MFDAPVLKVSPQKRNSGRLNVEWFFDVMRLTPWKCRQIGDIFTLQVAEGNVEVMQIIPSERLHQCFVKQRVDVTVPHVMKDSVEVDGFILQQVERIVEIPVPQEVEEIMVQTFTQERCHHCTVEQTDDAFVPLDPSGVPPKHRGRDGGCQCRRSGPLYKYWTWCGAAHGGHSGSLQGVRDRAGLEGCGETGILLHAGCLEQVVEGDPSGKQ